MLEYTITDLQPLTVYVIEVAAVNDAGIGIYGNIIAKTMSCKLQSLNYDFYTCSTNSLELTT